MAFSQSEDRRKHDRVGFKTGIKISLIVDNKEVKLESNSENLSLKGVFIDTDQVFPVGTACFVKIYLTGGQDDVVLSMQGTIVRQTQKGVGVEFDSMDVDTYSHLRNIVQYNRSNKSD